MGSINAFRWTHSLGDIIYTVTKPLQDIDTAPGITVCVTTHSGSAGAGGAGVGLLL